MGLYIVEFQKVRDRTVVKAGEWFQVRLEAEWDPPHEGGEEDVTLSCLPAEFTVEPTCKKIRVAADDETVAVTFRVAIEGPRSDKVDVLARSSESADGIFLRVEK